MGMLWQRLTTRGPKKPDAFCHIVWSYYRFFSHSFAPLIWFLLQSCHRSILWTKTPASQMCVVTSPTFLPSWSHSQDLTQDFPVTLDCSFQPPRQFYLSFFRSLFLFLYFFSLRCDHKHVRNNRLGFHQVPELWTEKTRIIPHYQESSLN